MANTAPMERSWPGTLWRAGLIGLLSVACWAGWLGWDTTYQLDPSTGVASGPYETWQVAGCVASLCLVVIAGTRILGPRRSTVITALAFTVSWSVDAANQDVTGLWLVGAILVLGGVTVGAASIAFTTAAVLTSRRRRQ